ncbi:erythronate-4-phosphate dehydrogenase family protein [Striga asiatica]|uniref:Erythronate-4-phosphate dehydrogenase family protein n=1 Tax=Striga asiatica TaxID=4170 RepID=A0A5A7PMJ9_STRAF|nr:erythronate-4-phosphate dehydrogenase family protein [Striga asiatica]
MENSHNSHSNGSLNGRNLHVMFSLPWFDTRVFYVRVSNFIVDDSTPECLTVNYIPLSPDTVLEVNGTRCSIESEGISCILRRDRVDKKSEEATFVSTDNVRFTGSVRFEVFDKEDLVISGVLEMSGTNGFTGESNNAAKKWSMNCESVISNGVGFLKGKQIMSSESLVPTIEVYVAGCFSGIPIILTKTLQVCSRKKHRNGMLNPIPEYDAAEESNDDVASGHDLQVADYKIYEPESEDSYWRRTEYMEGEDGELSWFNAGVRVGVGIGLGICLGVGIGVGLLVRTYQRTSKTIKRRLV